MRNATLQYSTGPFVSIPPLSQVSNPVLELKQAIATQDHAASLQLLKRLPLKKRWETLFLLQRAFSKNPHQGYIQALAHDLLYRAYRTETSGYHTEASRLYQLLIQHSPDHRITHKARQGFQRIQTGQTTSSPPLIFPTAKSRQHNEMGLLILQTIPTSQKQALALKFAQILQTDPYTARLSLPSIEFRMLRHGPAHELKALHQALLTADIPTHHVSLRDIQAIPVHDVLYIDSIRDRLTVQVRDPENSSHSIPKTINWSDITQRVNGLLPLFEEVVDRNQQGHLIRKTATQDHVQICDLHLSNHQGLLRFYDAGYQFNQGLSLVRQNQADIALDTQTSWAQWHGLRHILADNLPPIPEHQKFEHFATNVVEQIEILPQIQTHFHIFRKHECYWDQAFHLYSSLHYLNQAD